jgi:hypothetical protein
MRRAEALYAELKAEAEQRMRAGGSPQVRHPSLLIDQGRAFYHLGKLFNISAATIYQCQRIRRDAPDLEPQVRQQTSDGVQQTFLTRGSANWLTFLGVFRGVARRVKS